MRRPPCSFFPVFLLVLLASGCGSYSDFTLPPLEPRPGAVSFSWELPPEPVIRRGPAGAWDAVDVLNPSVVLHDGLYYNFYSGYDGTTWRTGLATSLDGLRWKRRGRILSPDPATWEGGYIAANGHALARNGEFLYWYQAGSPPRIGLAHGEDPRHLTRLPEPVLECGPRGSWDERGVADPYVLEVSGELYLYYLGQDRARRQRLGVARSTDGVNWTKLRSNPILELGPPHSFDETGLGEPAVWVSLGRYWMLYTARDRQEYRRLGLAVSADGVHWKRVSPEAALAGHQPWNEKVVCDPTVEIRGDGPIRVWYGGGDVAAPAQNIDGQIGLAILSLKISKP